MSPPPASDRGVPAALPKKRVFIDLTHLGRHVTGIERVSIEQFERVAFAGADVTYVRSNGVASMILRQQIWLPLLALLNPSAHFVFPGFPPSPLFVLTRNRVTLYVHDLFLITRRPDLGAKAKAYMAWPFAFAVRRLQHFQVNSEKTRAELVPFVQPGADIALYRPGVRNVFGLATGNRDQRPQRPAPLKIATLGTVEPRKNYAAMIPILDALAALGFSDAELHVIGREGWGDATAALKADPRVKIHGYLPASDAKALIEQADLYLCTSHDEGLGLPLVEVQYAGLPVIAPGKPVFHEVLGASGTFIDPADPSAAASAIASLLATPGWRASTSSAALANTDRWNALAQADALAARHMFCASDSARDTTK
jgi:glycosyltransferase involved in cell wall biosynthesis